MIKRIVSVTLAMAATAAFQGNLPSAQQGFPPDVRIASAVRADRSAPLSAILPEPIVNRPDRQIPNAVRFTPPGRGPKLAADPLVQEFQVPPVLLAPTPAPNLSFDGTSDDDNAAVAGGRVVPPDTNGDVGPNHYVQMNNSVFEIFDKQGNTVLGPLPNNALWSGFGGICQSNNDGDPIVFHDQLANRWVFSQFAIGSTGHQCFAVSQTPDPTGAYFAYQVAAPNFPDYPKYGVWDDAYFVGTNETDSPVYALPRAQMLAGPSGTITPVRRTTTDLPNWQRNHTMPADLDGPQAPAGSPGIFVRQVDDEPHVIPVGRDVGVLLAVENVEGALIEERRNPRDEALLVVALDEEDGGLHQRRG